MSEELKLIRSMIRDHTQALDTINKTITLMQEEPALLGIKLHNLEMENKNLSNLNKAYMIRITSLEGSVCELERKLML